MPQFYYLLTIVAVFVNGLTVSAQFSDDFSDGNFNNTPVWSGDSTNFIVNPSLQLQLNHTGFAATSMLSSSNALINLDSVEWQFYIKLNFAPSANNFARVYLVSDQSDLSLPLNGYYLQFGESGSADAIELFEQSGLISTSVCRAGDSLIASPFEARIRVRRDQPGNWTIAVDYSGGYNFIPEANGNNTTHNSALFLGLSCTYTLSNATNFYFDEFYSGPFVYDTIPPQIVNLTPQSSTQLDVYFNEFVELNTAQNQNNYMVNNGIGTAISATRDPLDSTLVHLTFSIPFVNGTTYTLTSANVTDISGNLMTSQNNNFMYLNPASPGNKSVLINEIFPDPSPQVGLPIKEYIELYNHSQDIFDLNGWEFSDGTSTAILPTYILFPGDYVIVCAVNDTGLFSSYGQTIGVSGFPTLNNAGDNLTLKFGTTLIDEVNYTDSWYRDDIKKSGGYSLELINPTIPCSDAANWIASEEISGGTPGIQNSVFDSTADTIPPYVVYGIYHSPDSIKIVFSEALDQTALGSLVIIISNGIGFIESLDNTNAACLWIKTNPDMTPGDVFTVSISGLTDCSGNLMSSSDIIIMVPEQAIGNDIIINELLFNPNTGGVDFVELYNRSDKMISLKNWKLANWSDSIANAKIISSETKLLMPGDFMVLSVDSTAIQYFYPLYATGTFTNMSSLPNYNNDSGTVFLLNNLGELTDKLNYSEDMHFALLNNVSGVSLERIDYERPSEDQTNWHSAAENADFATPGYQNSQYMVSINFGGEISVEPEIFTPDNDGNNDFLNINYSLNNPGFVANIIIFDAHGRRIRHLMQNELLGTQGIISWDGITDQNEKAATGIYVIFFEGYNVNGELIRIKTSCVLGIKTY